MRRGEEGRIGRIRQLALCFLVFATSPHLLISSSHAADTGPVTSLPLPRFASLKSDEVNVRAGPGTRYPIQFVYRRDALPVEIIEEFDQWRKIRDVEGSTGWVHRTMLEGKRTAMLKGGDIRSFRAEPRDDARRVFKAEPMTVGQLTECEKEWCRVQMLSRKGWIRKNYLWGAYPGEEFH